MVIIGFVSSAPRATVKNCDSWESLEGASPIKVCRIFLPTCLNSGLEGTFSPCFLPLTRGGGGSSVVLSFTVLSYLDNNIVMVVVRCHDVPY